jgi:hypothetical protein
MTTENDNRSESKQEQPKPERKYSQEQYEILSRSRAKKDMSEWNQWRKENPQKAVLLRGASLWEAHLKGADLRGAYLVGADLQGASLEGAILQNAYLWEAKLQGANLRETYLQGAKFQRTQLQGAEFGGAKLQGADFSRAIVDGNTLIWRCDVDHKTKFEGVALDAARIYPDIKQLLEYNIRRLNWRRWYRGKSKNKWIIRGRQLLTSPIYLFWCISNYGLSTWRIILSFLLLSMVFATVYFVWGAVDYYCLGIKDQPGIVNDLFMPIAAEKAISDVYYGAMIYLRSVYFSVVTTTTLGFGDMYANAARPGYRWWLGHILLIVQVILGYVLLGALVTRFAILFTAGGPAGKFSKKTKTSVR